MQNTKEIFGHPRGLYVLFFTEMWERFSYYGMRALLVLYMTKYLLVEIGNGRTVVGYTAFENFLTALHGPLSNQAISSHIYGLYTGFVYLTPFIGGLVADRYWGQKRSVYVGGFLMAIGHLLMAVESFFLLALFFLIIGNGFFKPNISTQVGSLYPQGDLRRDRAFTIFYMGINLGAFFSPLVCGTLGQNVGWHYGFGAAGIGMLIGLVVYHLGRHNLPPDRLELMQAQKNHVEEPLSREDYLRILALVILCALNIFFWGIYEQQGNTLQLFADRNTDWQILGFEVPSSWFQSFNPAIIILFAPVVDRFWGWQARRKMEPSSTMKMAVGCLLCGMAYLVMVGAAEAVGPEGKGSVLWLLSTVFVFTIGELYLSPVGLSLVTKLAPAKLVSMLMGVWFLSSFFGNYMSGYIGSYYETMGQKEFFILCATLGTVAAILFIVVRYVFAHFGGATMKQVLEH